MQMPQEGCDQQEYEELLASIKPINWAKFSGSDGDGEADKYCSGATCAI